MPVTEQTRARWRSIPPSWKILVNPPRGVPKPSPLSVACHLGLVDSDNMTISQRASNDLLYHLEGKRADISYSLVCSAVKKCFLDTARISRESFFERFEQFDPLFSRLWDYEGGIVAASVASELCRKGGFISQELKRQEVFYDLTGKTRLPDLSAVAGRYAWMNLRV